MKKRKLTAWLLTFVLLYPFTLFLAQGSVVRAASVWTKTYNEDGNTIYDVTGISGDSLLSWLGSHTNDNYYLGTPYAPYDNRNPNGDCSGKYGAEDTPGVASLNGTGFVWHALYKASGVSAEEAYNRIPCMESSGGAGGWRSWIERNKIKHKTYVPDSGSNEMQLINEVLKDGYISPGDLIWTWDPPVEMTEDGLPEDEDKYHYVGIFMGDLWKPSMETVSSRFWYYSEQGIYGISADEKKIGAVAPKKTRRAITVVKMSEEGNLLLKKKSINPDITADNSCYSLEGARYGIYFDPAYTVEAASVTTDASGKTQPVSLLAGTYYVRESAPPTGYILDPIVYTVNVRPKGTESIEIEEQPVYVTSKIEIKKVDRETGLPVPQGGATLAGAKFKFSFYKGHYKAENLPKQADQIWTASTEEVTDEKGGKQYVAQLMEKIPLGTLVIEEIQPPVGYRMEGAVFTGMQHGEQYSERILVHIRQDGDQAVISGGNVYEVAEQIIRGDLEGVKIGEGSHKRLAGVTFKIKGVESGETYEVTTDENGYFTTKTGESGQGMLPFGKYEITELPGKGNEGYNLIPPFYVKVFKDGQCIQLGTLTDKIPEDIPKEEESVPEEEKPSPKEEKKTEVPVIQRGEEHSPKTGDNTAGRALLLFILSCTSLPYCARIIKNN